MKNGTLFILWSLFLFHFGCLSLIFPLHLLERKGSRKKNTGRATGVAQRSQGVRPPPEGPKMAWSPGIKKRSDDFSRAMTANVVHAHGHAPGHCGTPERAGIEGDRSASSSPLLLPCGSLVEKGGGGGWAYTHTHTHTSSSILHIQHVVSFPSKPPTAGQHDLLVPVPRSTLDLFYFVC